jgi:hypothetical protein
MDCADDEYFFHYCLNIARAALTFPELGVRCYQDYASAGPTPPVQPTQAKGRIEWATLRLCNLMHS